MLALLALGACGAEPTQTEPPPALPWIVEDVGFENPVAAFHEEKGDTYLIANLGNPQGPVPAGFVSRVTPRGRVSKLDWIDGRLPDITLDQPYGFGLQGETLFVVDQTSVRLFRRLSGSQLGSLEVSGAIALRAVTISTGSQIMVTDSALIEREGKLEPQGNGSIFKIGSDGRARIFLKRRFLGNPTGIAAIRGGLAVVGYTSAELFSLDPSRRRTQIAKSPEAQLIGLVALPGREYLTASEASGAVYRIKSDGSVSTEIDGLDPPGAIGFDRTRQRILIPIPSKNRLEIHALPQSSE